MGLETIAWERVKACCSVGPREKSRWGEGEKEKRKERKSDTLREQRETY